MRAAESFQTRGLYDGGGGAAVSDKELEVNEVEGGSSPHFLFTLNP